MTSRRPSRARSVRPTVRRPRNQSRGRGCAVFFLIVLMLTLSALVYGAMLGWDVYRHLPDPEKIRNYQPSSGVRIVSADGVELAMVALEQRDPADYTEFPAMLVNAVVAAEDREFWTHLGVSQGILRALWVNIRQKRMAQGGSTITMQLARNAFLTQQKTLHRKIAEVLLALQIERNLSKQQIMELYLNQVYFGARAYGAKAAARVFYGKEMSQLTLGECAAMAGALRLPSRLNPVDNYHAAERARNRVLKIMRELDMITAEELTKAMDTPLSKPAASVERNSKRPRWRAPYYVQYVLREWETLKQSGRAVALTEPGAVTIQTTLSWKMQEEAEQALRQGLRAGGSQGALVCVDPYTGAIRAMVGGVDYAKTQFNHASQGRRQPGSAFKPVVYAAAVAAGKIDADSIVDDQPLSLPGGRAGKPWRPKNLDGRFRGRVPVRLAIAMSLNVPAVNVMRMVGPQRVIDMARSLGMKSPLEPNLSLALGTSAVSPLEMASAYGVFAAGGDQAEPHSITRVVQGGSSDAAQDGAPIWENPLNIRRAAISPSVAAVMNDLLEQPIKHRSGTAARQLRGFPDAHGKTGTTDQRRDVWFVGYTSELSTAVWVADPEGSATNPRYRPMPTAWGSTVCAPIWKRFMTLAVKEQQQTGGALSQGRPAAPITMERTVTVRICAESGKMAHAGCPEVFEEQFPEGFEPREICDEHKRPVRRAPKTAEPQHDETPDVQPQEPPDAIDERLAEPSSVP